MRYSGLVEVEFKRDPRDGRLKLLDVNPRVWGWHALGERAGTDFAHLQWRLSHAESVPSLVARAGVRWVRLTTDVPTAIREAARGQLSPTSYLRSLHGPLADAIWSADDPLPALAEMPLLAYVAAARAIRQRVRGLPSPRAAQSAMSEL